jgi:uncharacterized protein (DUF433 family)
LRAFPRGLVGCRDEWQTAEVPTVSVLDRTIYAEADAARLLSLAPATLHYWLEGGTQRGRTYKPVLRVEPTGERVVTWAEFVEAGLLRQYRRELRVPMAEMRAFIERLRNAYGVPYPLAHAQPFVADRRLLLETQTEAKLPAEFWLVAEVSDQLLLLPPSEAFVQRVRWNDGVASAWRPHRDPASPVLIDPDVRFGQPSVGGVSTETIWEHYDGGETDDEIAKDFDLDVSDVRWALAYENSVRSPELALVG